MSKDLRCENKKHGVMIDDHTIEIKCNSSFCGARPGVVVLHRFDVRTREITGTSKFKSPNERNIR